MHLAVPLLKESMKINFLPLHQLQCFLFAAFGCCSEQVHAMIECQVVEQDAAVAPCERSIYDEMLYNLAKGNLIKKKLV